MGAPEASASSRRAERRVVVRVLPVLLAAALVLPAGTLTSAALAQTRSSGDIERELDRARGEIGNLDGQLGDVRTAVEDAEEELAVLTVRLEDARARLIAAEGQVALAEAALEEAENERDAAREAQARAEARLADTIEELAFEEARFAEQLVESFKYGTVGAQRGAMVLEMIRRVEDPNEFAVALKQLRTVISNQDAVVTRVTELRELRAQHAEDAARERQRADEAAEEAAETLAIVEQLREEAAAVAAEIASDEARQRDVLASLVATQTDLEALRRRTAAREAQLRSALSEARVREARLLGDRSRYPGAGGGPDIPGSPCPVTGAVAGRDFSNDWGYPRSGGRWHQGNDIFAARGAPVVAVADGVVLRTDPANRQTRLGGITITYRTADGSEWYNAHLGSIASGIGPGVQVSRGQQIGAVGNTGNAITTPPHLHLGRRYNGEPVNPWPTISAWCR